MSRSHSCASIHVGGGVSNSFVENDSITITSNTSVTARVAILEGAVASLSAAAEADRKMIVAMLPTIERLRVVVGALLPGVNV